MPHIRWIEDEQAEGDLAAIQQAWRAANPGRDKFPDILKCFTLRPDYLRSVMEFSDVVHFSEGFLTRRVKEMIATYVSSLNQCVY
jgi:alkylhydroperoxidase family enzyme